MKSLVWKIKPRTRSKNVKVQKLAVLKATGAVFNIANSLLDLKSNIFLSANDMQKNINLLSYFKPCKLKN